jgi:cholesterol oxidase
MVSRRQEVAMTKTEQTSSVTRREIFKGAAGAAAAGIGIMATKEAAAQEVYDAIVIGTGFGGTIATIALSTHQKKVLVIERGTFWITPETLGNPTAPSNAIADWAKSKNMRVQYWPRPDHALGIIDLLSNRYRDDNPYGLHNYRMFRQAHILTASGVGGGSLIYSNVNLRARDAVLDRIGLKGIDYDRAERYMEKFRGKLAAVVTKIPLPPGVSPEQLGDHKLDPQQDKDKLANKAYLLLDRSRALRDAAGVVGTQLGIQMPWSPLKLSVTEYVHGADAEADGTHTFCERQGRCLLGCLPAARHTLNKTLYKWVLSKDERVTLSPESEVRTIKRVGNTYEVTYVDRRGDNFNGREITVRAAQVFLAAGVLGTAEILLRSRRDGLLQLSDRLGFGFSTNGDFGAFAVGTTMRTADGKPVVTPSGTPAKMSVYPTRGPINTCDIRFEVGGRHFTVEDCGIPSMFARIVRTGIDDRKGLLALADPEAFVSGHTGSIITRMADSIKAFLHGSTEREPSKDRHATEAELIDDVFFFNAMSEDDANGFFFLKGDELDLDWPADKPIANHPSFAKVEEILQRLSQAMGGTYTPLPPWEGLPLVFDKKTLVITHPIGGCRIGPTMAEGVVNEFGQVYDGSKKTTDRQAVHPGLFIVDGSVIPGALAANPTLTISAQALKAVEKAVGPLQL